MTDLAFRRPAEGHDSEDSILGAWWHGVDRWSLGAVFLLIAAGVVLGLAASVPLAERNGLGQFHYVIRQAGFAALGLVVLIAVSMASLRRVRRLGLAMFLVSLVLVALLPVFGTDFGKGAVRWYSLGVTSLQPSEFLKPGFVIAAGWLMAGSMERGGPPGRTLSAMLMIAISLMLAMQPDFGQATLVFAVWAAMFFTAGAPILLLISVGGIGALGAVFAYRNSEHLARRIDSYFAAEVDPNTQLAYAQSAISEGGFFGVGIGEGSVKWTLPDAHTDFIIAVAAEEFGLVLTLMIIATYLFITLRALIRLLDERDAFTRLAGTGLATLIGLQAFVNLSVAIRLLPAKGMTLPFVSYGGSSMLAGAIGVGALLALTRRRTAGPGRTPA